MTLIASLLFASSPTARAAETSVVWTGLDYGLVRYNGDTPFRTPEMFETFPSEWNRLFRNELMSPLAKRIRVPVTDGASKPLDAMQTEVDVTRQLIDDTALTGSVALLSEADIVARIATYPKAEAGLGLAMIADVFNRPDGMGCYWVTWYDRASLEVHETTRTCREAGGVGFRNFWFGSVKEIVSDLPRELPLDIARVTVTAEEADAAVARQAELDGRWAKPETPRPAPEAAPATRSLPSDWVTIHVSAEGLAVLKAANVDFRVSTVQPR